MTIDKLIAELERIKQEPGVNGFTRVCVDSFTHSFSPELVVRERNGKKVLVLNA